MTREEMIEIIENDDRWDTGELGRDEEFARPVYLPEEVDLRIDEMIRNLKKTQTLKTA